MNTQPATLETQVRAIVEEFVRCDVSSVPADADLVERFGLDSLQGLKLLATLEKRLCVRFPDARLSELRTIASLVDAIDPSTELPR